MKIYADRADAHLDLYQLSNQHRRKHGRTCHMYPSDPFQAALWPASESQPTLWRLGRKVAGQAGDPVLSDTARKRSTLPDIHGSWRMAFNQRTRVVLELIND